MLYAGKPHQPIYDLALEKVEKLRGRPVDPHRVLAIGDSVRTDVSGAIACGLDCLFVTAGIHAEGRAARSRSGGAEEDVCRRRRHADRGDA